MTTEVLPAVILAGGRASRMGGGDKSLRRLGGRRILDLVIDRVSAQCAPIAINANGDLDRFSEFGLQVIPDGVPNQPGPLAGVLAAMDWVSGLGHSAVVSVAADTPFFPSDLSHQLAKNAVPSGLALAATRGPDGKILRHPTFGIWPVALREDLRTALSGGLRKIVLWTDRHNAGIAEFGTFPFDPFFNINTPEDLDTAETLIARVS